MDSAHTFTYYPFKQSSLYLPMSGFSPNPCNTATSKMLSRYAFTILLQGALLALADTTESLQVCTTFFGARSKNPIPTDSVTLTFTSKATAKTVYTPVFTITPKPITITFSSTVTATTTNTLHHVTDTFSTTETDYLTCPSLLQEINLSLRLMVL